MDRPLSALIADDEPHARRGIRTLIERDPELVCTAECADGPSTIDAIRANRPDIVVLDVQMPGLDGFEVIEAIGIARMPVTVFVTAFERYAIRAFKVSAVDYVTKPFDDDAFSAAMARAKRATRTATVEAMQEQLRALLAQVSANVHERPPQYLTRIAVKDERRTMILSVADVDWIEAADYYVKLHVAGTVRLLRATLDALEAQLDPAQFFRLHRSGIVNLGRIRELRPTFRGEHVVVLHDGTRLRLPRRRRALLEASLRAPAAIPRV
jgi:two-component system LytT family response regulator